MNKVLNGNKNLPAPSTVTYEEQSIDRPVEIVEASNNYFVTIGPKLAQKIKFEESDDQLKYIADKGSSTSTPRFEISKGYTRFH